MDENYTSNYDLLQMLAKRMKEYRLAARMSQRELADKSGVSYTTICRFEQGKHPNISLSNFISYYELNVNRSLPFRKSSFIRI